MTWWSWTALGVVLLGLWLAWALCKAAASLDRWEERLQREWEEHLRSVGMYREPDLEPGLTDEQVVELQGWLVEQHLMERPRLRRVK